MCWLIGNFLWTCFSGLLSPYVPMECLLILEAGIVGFVWEKCEGEDLCDLLGLGSVKKGRHSRFSIIEPEMRLGVWIWGKRGRRDLQLAHLVF